MITSHCEPKTVIHDVASYVASQELCVLFKLLAMAHDDIAAGRVRPLDGVKERIRASAQRK